MYYTIYNILYKKYCMTTYRYHCSPYERGTKKQHHCHLGIPGRLGLSIYLHVGNRGRDNTLWLENELINITNYNRFNLFIS